MQERVFAILTPRPLFHDKDFHAQLAAMTQRMAREAQRFNQQAQLAWPEAERVDELTAIIDDTGQLLALRGDATGGPSLARTGGARRGSALHLLASAFAELALARAPAALRDDPLHQLFFASQAQRFTRFETTEHPLLIQHWLSRLSLSEREHQLCLSVTAAEDDPEWLEIAIEIIHQGKFTPLKTLLERREASPQLAVMLADLAILADTFPELEALYGETPEDALGLSLHAFTPVFTDILPALTLLGIQVKLPKALQKLAYPRVNVALSKRSSSHQPAYLNLDELLHFDWRIVLGEQVYHGNQRKLQAAQHDIVLTSYGLARSDYKVLSRVSWRTLVIDEAQNIKNPGARQTKVIKQYRADIRIAMSGTPVENRLGEYWSLFDFTNQELRELVALGEG